MIRPLTIVSCMLAFGSGLYLYQSKHEVQLLDRSIERTLRETSTLRDQSRLLAAEWTMLNDFDRLRQFSDTYLTLKSITPSQFTSVADLGNRLPAPRAEVPAHAVDETLRVLRPGGWCFGVDDPLVLAQRSFERLDCDAVELVGLSYDLYTQELEVLAPEDPREGADGKQKASWRLDPATPRGIEPSGGHDAVQMDV